MVFKIEYTSELHRKVLMKVKYEFMGLTLEILFNWLQEHENLHVKQIFWWFLKGS